MRYSLTENVSKLLQVYTYDSILIELVVYTVCTYGIVCRIIVHKNGMSCLVVTLNLLTFSFVTGPQEVPPCSLFGHS